MEEKEEGTTYDNKKYQRKRKRKNVDQSRNNPNFIDLHLHVNSAKKTVIDPGVEETIISNVKTEQRYITEKGRGELFL